MSSAREICHGPCGPSSESRPLAGYREICATAVDGGAHKSGFVMNTGIGVVEGKIKNHGRLLVVGQSLLALHADSSQVLQKSEVRNVLIVPTILSWCNEITITSDVISIFQDELIDGPYDIHHKDLQQARSRLGLYADGSGLQGLHRPHLTPTNMSLFNQSKSPSAPISCLNVGWAYAGDHKVHSRSLSRTAIFGECFPKDFQFDRMCSHRLPDMAQTTAVHRQTFDRRHHDRIHEQHVMGSNIGCSEEFNSVECRGTSHENQKKKTQRAFLSQGALTSSPSGFPPNAS